MGSLTTILEPSLDGMIHLSVPKEMLGKKVRVVASVIDPPKPQPSLATEDNPLKRGLFDDHPAIAKWRGSDPTNRKRAMDALRSIAATGGIQGIEDALAWQREIRKDRPLPGRDE